MDRHYTPAWVGKSTEAAVADAGFCTEALGAMAEAAGVSTQAFVTELVQMACERLKRDMADEPELEAVLVMRLEEARQHAQREKQRRDLYMARMREMGWGIAAQQPAAQQPATPIDPDSRLAKVIRHLEKVLTPLHGS
jgi:hypothetical protein